MTDAELYADVLAQEIRRYNSIDAARVSARIRDIANIEPAIDRLVELYQEVLAEFAGSPPRDAEAEARASARCLRQLGDMTKAARAGLRNAENRQEPHKKYGKEKIRSPLRHWFHRG